MRHGRRPWFPRRRQTVERLKARRLGWHAARLQPLGFALEMKLQLFAEIGFTGFAKQQRSQTALQNVPEAHQVLCNTRLTPADRRSHFETSTASCLRPALVSE